MHDMSCPRLRHRLATLQAHHARLEAQLSYEFRQPMPDSLRLMALKRRTLHLKDQIIRLQPG